MDTGAPAAGDLLERAHTFLAEAQALVRRQIEVLDPALGRATPARSEAYLETLCGELDRVIDGAEPGPLRGQLAASPLCASLMDELGDKLISADTMEPGSSEAVMIVLRAWSSLRRTMVDRRGTSGDPREDLRLRMRSPDAFELLLETAHDFRSPLGSILFLSEALRDGHSGELTELQRSQLGLIYSAAFGLSTIASDIMDLAREQKGLIAGEPVAFRLAEVFSNVEKMVRPIVEEKGLELRVAVPDRWQVSGHPHALSRVLLNLTTNALKFTDEGFVELGVVPQPHGRVEFYVHDTGRGISPEQQQTLFQPFRTRSGDPEAGHHFSGTGIGLSMARRLLHAMGSDLTLSSSDEHGTRFSFVLSTAGRKPK